VASIAQDALPETAREEVVVGPGRAARTSVLRHDEPVAILTVDYAGKCGAVDPPRTGGVAFAMPAVDARADDRSMGGGERADAAADKCCTHSRARRFEGGSVGRSVHTVLRYRGRLKGTGVRADTIT